MREQTIQEFTLENIGWGYRDLLASTLESLAQGGHLSEDRPEVREIFLSTVSWADRHSYDDVLMEFLHSMGPATYWLLDHPDLFRDVVNLGMEHTSESVPLGARYFAILGEGGFGPDPEGVRHLLGAARRLRKVDSSLALTLLERYGCLSERLSAGEIDRFVEEGLRLWELDPGEARGFLDGRLRCGEVYIRELTGECHLEDIREELVDLASALAGMEMNVASLEELDHVERLKRKTTMVVLSGHLYLPPQLRVFDSVARNRMHYKLLAVIAAASLDVNSFPRVHGLPECATCEGIAGRCLPRVNLFRVAEEARILRSIRQRWPGARRLLEETIQQEFKLRPARTTADMLLWRLISPDGEPSADERELLEVIDASGSLFETLHHLTEGWALRLVDELPGLSALPLRTLPFMPDFLFPVSLDESRGRNRLQEELARVRDILGDAYEDPEGGAREDVGLAEEEDQLPPREDIAGELQGTYLYDEWSQPDGVYLKEHCSIHEILPLQGERSSLPEGVARKVEEVRRTFELLRPEMIRKEKFLQDGESINADQLVRFLVARSLEPAPRVDFYERPAQKQRDMAVLLLMDVSGSTGQSMGERQVLELEQEAVMVMGESLALLDDRFAISGFSGTGRDRCEYYFYKGFEEPWSPEVIGRIQATRPLSATRIGPALRHSTHLLSRVEARTRLILLITDGKPSDAGYDPQSRYAQHDVRMACEESWRAGIRTYCVSTEENTSRDLSLMFPGERFIILEDIADLPRLLPRLYLRITS